MIVVDQPHDLSADDEAALVAYVDGRLDSEERGRVEARAAQDPSFAAALALQQQGRDAIVTASEGAGAPLALRARVEALERRAAEVDTAQARAREIGVAQQRSRDARLVGERGAVVRLRVRGEVRCGGRLRDQLARHDRRLTRR